MKFERMKFYWIAVVLILSIRASASCGSFLGYRTVIGREPALIGAPFVSLSTLKMVDEILLPNSALREAGVETPFTQTIRDWAFRFFLNPSVIHVTEPQLVQASRNLTDLKNRLYRFIQRSDQFEGLPSIVWAISDHWKREGVSHKILGSISPHEILVLPRKSGSLLEDFAYDLKREINLDLVVEPSIYRQGNAGIERKIRVLYDGSFRIEGKFYLPLESVFEPNSISDSLIHEIIHAVGLEMLKNQQSYLLLGKMERLRSDAAYSSQIQTPPMGVGRGQNLEYRLPYEFTYGFDEMEAHDGQAQGILAEKLLPNKELLYSGLIISAQIKYLVGLAVNLGPEVVKRGIGWTSEFGLTGTLAFEFGPPFGLLMFYLPMPEFKISRSEYALLKGDGRSQLLARLEGKVRELGAVAATREMAFWSRLQSEDRRDLTYFVKTNGN
ncbi:MAG: hypothetical protein IPK68_23385 [Bdellovibrionales bacterium]|nr:hypothetical protein [Bdellovibrionales bacterium]